MIPAYEMYMCLDEWPVYKNTEANTLKKYEGISDIGISPRMLLHLHNVPLPAL